MCRSHADSVDTVQREPYGCPFTVRKLNSTTYLIRENDRFGEFPHIYVKICSQTDVRGQRPSVLLINDTGVGTSVPSHDESEPPVWNIKSFIDRHFNPGGETPYLVVLSHCHYDHILGLEPLLHSQDADTRKPVTILSSSHQRSFLAPYATLEEHSLCKSNKLSTPVYETSMWATDRESVVYKHPSGIDMPLPITTLHTPGHTPDSLSWYDVEERTLYVGDSLYEEESVDSKTAPWGRESPAPILFTNEANLYDWWQSIGKLVTFVEDRNLEKGKRVALAAGHVTASVDALTCLLCVKQFMAKVLRDNALFVGQPPKRGEPFGHWTDNPERDIVHSFSLGAPIRLVDEGRHAIPEAEWR